MYELDNEFRGTFSDLVSEVNQRPMLGVKIAHHHWHTILYEYENKDNAGGKNAAHLDRHDKSGRPLQHGYVCAVIKEIEGNLNHMEHKVNTTRDEPWISHRVH
jgi:hypothetical protein